MKKVLILGVNGFIGHHLSKRILETTDWHVYGMDMQSNRISDLLENEACVVGKRETRGRRPHAAPASLQERRPERLLHAPHPRAG